LQLRNDKVLEEFENNLFTEEVPPHEVTTSNPIFYMPHRPVVKLSSHTTKVRPVFDASAKSYNGQSLNDFLETGPSLNSSIVDILLRFQRWPVSLSADVTDVCRCLLEPSW
jgi:hypothetical protein